MTSQEQLARMLRLVPYLRGRQGVTVAEVAEAFGVSPRIVLSDLTVLQFCGLPGGYPDDLFEVDIDAAREEGVIYHFENADVLSRPLRLRPAEAASLMAALGLVADLAGDQAPAASALAKLRGTVGEASQAVLIDVDSGRAPVRAALIAAIEDRTVVRLVYRRAGESALREADVEPARLHNEAGFGYLDAWSRSRGAWRSFRLDRIADVYTSGESFEPREAEPAGWFDDAPTTITLTLAPEAEWVAEYYPSRSVQRTEAGMEVALPVASRSWAISLLLRLGGGVRACSDEALVAAARAEAREALNPYSVGQGSLG
ncbi:MAG TPA: WYL domain-containing protein [Arachnia sp.]|nr:WYL domain-containing protein [Arachnia sp.]HMT86207.1 WYL domain-containing protein [Arachnia sp.]